MEIACTVRPARKEASMCGHRAVAKGRVTAFGFRRLTEQARMIDGRFNFCHACLGEMAIRCAWCKGPIFIGDPITLYSAHDDFIIPDHAAVYTLERRLLVGCGNIRCADSGADYCGVWVPANEQRDGRWIGAVQRFPTMYERLLADVEQGGEGYVVISDLLDPGQTQPTPGFTIPERMPLSTGET